MTATVRVWTLGAAAAIQRAFMEDRRVLDIELLRRAYAAFNGRDIDAALVVMAPDVTWPKAFKGGFARGHQEVRAYWTEQWSEIDPHVEPVWFRSEGGGRILVGVHQVVREPGGAVVFDGHVGHRFTIESGLIRAMEVCALEAPVIGLDGARLRSLRADDVEALHGYLRDPAVTELTSYPVVSVAMVEGMIERSRSRWEAGEPSRWGIALEEGDRLVGTCGFNEWSRVHGWAELAFDLAREQWGKGRMRQAVGAVLRWAFEQEGIHRVQAFVRVDNRRSERVLEGSGFVREGRLRSFRVCRGERHDFHLYGLLRADRENGRGGAT